MNTPFPSRRSRRCASTACVHAGRVRPGQLVLRVGHRQFIHVDDVVYAFRRLAAAARVASTVLVTFAEAFPPVAAAASQVMLSAESKAFAARASLEARA